MDLDMNSAEAIGSLYVGNLPLEVNEGVLFQLFAAQGPILSIRLCRDKSNGQSLGYAYVNFYKKDDAERALNVMNFEDVRGQRMRIMWSQRDSSLRKSPVGNVFIRNLDPQTDERALHYIFAPHGKIVSTKVAMNEENESKGYGFVQFEDAESASRAIEKLNGMIVMGRRIYVSEFVPKAIRQNSKETKFTNIYVKNFTPDVDDSQLMEIFKKYGAIKSSKVMKDDQGNSRCFGFINYAESEEAAAAIFALNGKHFNGKCLYVSRAEKKMERKQKLNRYLNEIHFESNSNDNCMNHFNDLFVQNLPQSIKDAELRQLFEGYGDVFSAKVVRNEEGISKGFGFVKFFESQSALRAIQEANGIAINGKILYVAKTLTKKERKLLKEKIEMNNLSLRP